MNTTEKPIYCKSCFEEIHLSPMRQIIEKKPLLCDKCISKVIKKLEWRKIKGINILFLSDYKGMMKTWLMNYKEYGDEELAPCFLYVFRPILHLLFSNFVFVPCPSSLERIQKRNFDHLPRMLETSKIPFVEVLIRDDENEQKQAKGIMRFQEKSIHLTKEGKERIENKKIILFDDVFTTGSTFFQSMHELEKCSLKAKNGVILMDNEHLEERKILLR